ncbi:MAG: SpoIIE family protein phosphatase [Calditrichia bacterium]
MEHLMKSVMGETASRAARSATHILIVDDEPDLALLIQQKFRHQIKNGIFRFLSAADGVEALEILDSEEAVDIVLTDINMPRMDGLTLLSKIRQRKNPLLKSIVISAYGDLKNIRQAMNNGAFDFITKPINLSDLETTISKTLEELAFLRRSIESQNAYIALQQQLAIAQDIQSALLPGSLPTASQLAPYEVFACMDSAQEVGGDFYDYFVIDPEHLGVVIGDVCGKGVPAAIFMAVSKTTIRSIGMGGGTPAECLNRVNSLLVDDSKPDYYVTVFYGILNIHTGVLEYCNAGHNLPFLIQSENQVIPVPHSGGIPLGFVSGFQYENRSLQLQKGDTLFMYTDGITESFDTEQREFTENKLNEVLSRNGHYPLSELCGSVLETVHRHSNNAPQSDDMTLLGLRMRA